MFFLPLLLSFEPTKIDLPLKSPFEIKKENKSPKLIEKIDSYNQTDSDFNDIEVDDNFLDWAPIIQGEIPYSFNKIKTLLSNCKKEILEETLNSCAAKLNAELVSDGYTNSRVYSLLEGDNGTLDVIMGRIYELKVRSDNKFIQQKVFKLLSDLNGQILHQPTLQKKLSEAKEIKNVGQISGDIGRLGSDPTKAILKINATYLPSEWQRQINTRNDGSPGTGQWRNIGTFVKTDIFILKYGYLASIYTKKSSI